MNTVLVQYGHSVRTKQYTKNPNAKYAVKAEISMKTISFNNSAKRSAFSTKSVDARGDSSHCKKRVLRR